MSNKKWQRWDDFGDFNDPEDTQIESVEPVASEPEPTPEPKPAPAPVPAPVKNSVVSKWDGSTLNAMAAHLRKREKLRITLDEAKDMLLNNPEIKSEYEKLKNLGKF